MRKRDLRVFLLKRHSIAEKQALDFITTLLKSNKRETSTAEMILTCSSVSSYEAKRPT